MKLSMASFSVSAGNHCLYCFYFSVYSILLCKIWMLPFSHNSTFWLTLGLYNPKVLVFTISWLQYLVPVLNSWRANLSLLTWIKHPLLVNLLVVTKKEAGTNMATYTYPSPWSIMTSNTFLTIIIWPFASHSPFCSLLSTVCKNENDNIVVTSQRDWVEKNWYRGCKITCRP